MEEEIIEIIVSHDGSEIQLEAKGFTGKKCSIALESLGRAIGQVSSISPKSEFYDIEKEVEVIVTRR